MKVDVGCWVFDMTLGWRRYADWMIWGMFRWTVWWDTVWSTGGARSAVPVASVVGVVILLS